MNTTDLEVWIILDEDGNYVVGTDRDAAVESYDSNVSGDAAVARRVLRVSLTVPTPAVVELSGAVSDVADIPPGALTVTDG